MDTLERLSGPEQEEAMKFEMPSNKVERMEFDSKKAGEDLRKSLGEVSSNYEELSSKGYLQGFEQRDFTNLFQKLQDKSYDLKSDLEKDNMKAIAEQMKNALISIADAKYDKNPNLKFYSQRASEIIGRRLKTFLETTQVDAYEHIKNDGDPKGFQDIISSYTKYKGGDPINNRIMPV